MLRFSNLSLIAILSGCCSVSLCSGARMINDPGPWDNPPTARISWCTAGVNGCVVTSSARVVSSYETGSPTTNPIQSATVSATAYSRDLSTETDIIGVWFASPLSAEQEAGIASSASINSVAPVPIQSETPLPITQQTGIYMPPIVATPVPQAVSAAPEPATTALAGLGLVVASALFVLRRRWGK